MYLNIGTSKSRHSPFETNGEVVVLGVPILKHFRVFIKSFVNMDRKGWEWGPSHSHWQFFYSRASVAQTLMACLPRPFRTRS